MKYLNRYIAVNVITATILVLAVLAGMESFMLFFGEMNTIGREAYTVDKALIFVLAQMPFQLYQLFPMAGFLGCLIGLGKLSASGELVVMRANGVSIIGIAISVVKAALVMILIVTLIGESAAPQLQAYSQRMKAAALGKDKNYASLGGIWLRNQNEFIHINTIDAVDRAKQVSTFIMDGHRLIQASFALNAAKVIGGWEMKKVKQTDFLSRQVNAQELSQSLMGVEFDPILLSLRQASINQLSVMGLHQSIKYRREAKLDTEQYQFAFWQRLLQPLISVIMICLGVPFIFASPRDQSMGLRVLVGIIIGFGFYTLNQFLGPLAVVYQIPPIIAALLPVVIFSLAYGILVRRI